MGTAAQSGGHKPFVHLHLHTQYSLLDGAIRIPDLMNKCAELNQPAVAVTDHGVMFASVPFIRQAREAGIKPIIGCELYLLADGDYRDRETKVKPNHITVLVRNETGYKNLSKLVSEAYINGFYYKPRVDMNLLAEHAEGLVALSGCLNGVLCRSFLSGKPDQAEEYARRLRDIFGEERFFVELQNHGLDEQVRILDPLYDLAQRLGLPTVATNDCHYLNADDYEAHDMLLCIGTGKMVADENRLRYDSHQYYVKSGEEMAEAFSGKYAEAVDNTLRVAQMCDFDFEAGVYHLPAYKPPGEHTIDSYFEQVARKGLEERMPVIRRRIESGETDAAEKDYRERLEYEIGVIKEMGFSGYFLIVWDFIRYAKENDIPVGPGRGSGAGSVVAYSLGITGIDPLQYDLLFERFLNPDRISMPDFDIDFCMRRRGEVIEYVTDKYGWKNVAQIITFGTMKARNAIRDVGRVMDLPYGDVDKVAKMIPDEMWITLERALKESPDLKEAYDSDEIIKKMIDVAMRLEGLTRHASTHAAGVVIAPKPLLNYLPLYKSNKDEITTQFDMNDVEAIGLIKMDFLGLRTLTVLQDTVDAVKRDHGVEIDIDNLPDGDKKAYQLLSSGKTCGIFQFESRGMRELLMRYRPEHLLDLSALNALYRPGPIKGGLLDDFIERKHGRKKVQYIHPDIEELTRETYGVILYQEQVMQIASKIAGFTLGEADILRRAMGKKKRKLMAKMKKKFLQGSAEHGLKAKKAQEIYDYIDKFSGYGFNKSHSTAYGLVAYQTAYLKAHYPAYFMAALMSSEMENSDRIKVYLNECRELGIEVLPPDVNRSVAPFTVEDEAIRYSLAAVKNVGSGAVQSVVEERDENGPFTDIFDFCERVDLRAMNKRAIESMIKAGCFDGITPIRARLAAVLDKAYEAGQKATRDRLSGQENLFGGPALDGPPAGVRSLPDVKEWADREKLAYEKECLGFYLSGHPLGHYAAELRAIDSVHIDELHGRKSSVTVAGIITRLRKRQTRAGNLMASFVLEDDSGSVETLVFPDAFKTSYRYLIDDAVVVVEGSVKNEADSLRLFAAAVIPLAQHKGLERKVICIDIDAEQFDETRVRDLVELLRENRGEAKLSMHFRRGKQYDAELHTTQSGIAASDKVLARLTELVGEENVHMNRRRGDLALS